MLCAAAPSLSRRAENPVLKERVRCRLLHALEGLLEVGDRAVQQSLLRSQLLQQLDTLRPLKLF